VTLTHLGHDVLCAEIDPARLELLRAGKSPILEAGLEELIADGFERGLLGFVDNAAEAARDAEFVFLCVQTPMGDDGRADMSFVERATEEVASALESGSIVVTKSTVPVGSSRIVERVLQREDVAVVSSPEFLQEGMAVHNSLHPDRIVIGSTDSAAAIRVDHLFSGISAPRLITDPPSAETIKYASNSFLAMKISFANAVAALCEAVGADVADVLTGMGYDPRIGFEFLRPGPGWGGSCFPKDLRALKAIGDDSGYDFALLQAVIDVNDEQFARVVEKVATAAGHNLKGKTIGVLGLAFKARTADVRYSPSLEVIGRLIDAGATVRAYDPAVSELRAQDGIELCGDAYAACDGADVLVVLTEWDEFRWLDFDKIAGLVANRAIVDARNLLESAPLLKLGFSYVGIGR